MPSKRKVTKYGHLYAKMNQLGNVRNYHQGSYKRVLFVCSAGLLRSATAAHVFSAEPYNWNTRTAGADNEYALNPVNEALLAWADVVYLMEGEHLEYLERTFQDILDVYRKKIRVLDIPDRYPYRDPALIDYLKKAVAEDEERVAAEAYKAAQDEEASTPLDDDF
jgi:predicted protein tyrosine phosphatase